MVLRKILILICPTTGAACLAIGYVIVGSWLALAVALLTFLVWLLAYKRPSLCPPSAALVVSVGLAATGVFAGASPFLMLPGATLALAGWDLVLLAQTLTGSSSSSAKTVTLLENMHYSSLALALGPGLLIAIAGRMIHLQIPFGGMVLLMILALFSLDRAWRTLIS